MIKLDLIIAGVSIIKRGFPETSISVDLFGREVVYDMDTNDDTFSEHSFDEYITEIMIPSMEYNRELLEMTHQELEDFKKSYNKEM